MFIFQSRTRCRADHVAEIIKRTARHDRVQVHDAHRFAREHVHHHVVEFVRHGCSDASEGGSRIRRTTASVSYHASTSLGPWQTTLAWGQNQKLSPSASERLPGWLAESTLVAHERHTFFGRLEQVRNDELFHGGEPLAGQAFRVRKISAGYIYDFIKTGKVSWGVGGLVGVHSTPSALEPYYGKRPTSAMVFLQGRL